MNLTEQQFSEAIEYLEERLEVLIARPKDFFNKEIHLFKSNIYINPKEFDGVVRTTFLNGGTNLSGPRPSSFWSDSKITAIFYGLRSELNNIFPSNIPELDGEKSVFNAEDCHLVAFCKDEKYKKDILTKIKNNKIKNGEGFLLYELIIKGSDPDLGIGHNPSIREFTIDRDVVPNKTEIITKWPDEFINKIEWISDVEEYKRRKNIREDPVGTMEKIVKHWPSKDVMKNHNLNPKKLIKTEFFKNEFIENVNSGKYNFYLISDAHIGKNCKTYRDVLNQAYELGDEMNKIIIEKKPIYILILGDFVDKSWHEKFEEIMKTFNSAVDPYVAQKTKVLYIFGNSEYYESPRSALEKIFDKKKAFAWAGYKIETDKFVFSHAPVNVEAGKINIHGHLHNSNKYWNADPKKCINISKEKGKFISFKDVLKIGVSENGEKLKEDPTGGKKNKVMIKLYKQYLKEDQFSEAIQYLEESIQFKTTTEKKNGGTQINFYINGKNIGRAAVCDTDGKPTEHNKFLYNVDIWEEFRGKGYGTKIMEYMIDKYNIDTLNVKRSNKIAINLYKKFGFEFTGEKFRQEDNSITERMIRKKSLKESQSNSILDKAKQIMEKMNNIEYGSVYADGRITKRDKNDWYDDSNKFCPQPVQSILKTKVGHCIDQSELERYYFRQAGIKYKVFSMFPERGSNRFNNHTFLVFFDEENKPYWFDHAWYSERGIHKGETLNELFAKICDKKRLVDPWNEKEKKVFANLKYEIFEVPAMSSLCWDDYIKWVWKQKLVYKG